MAKSRHLRQRIAYFESLRGLAAMVLVFFHLQANTPLIDNTLVGNAWMMLDFFFVLSGAVITMAFHAQMGTLAGVIAFGWGRFLRLYPLHLVMLLVFLAFEYAKYLAVTRLGMASDIAPFEINNAASFLHNLFMTHMLFMDHLTWNKPSWSISAEFWTYVLYAALAFALRARPRAFLLASGLIAAAGFQFLLTHDMSAGHGLARSLYAFFVGVLLAHFVGTTRLAFSTRALNLTFIAVGTLLVTGPWPYDQGYSVLFSTAFIALLLVLFRSPDDGAIKRALSHPLLVRLGTISFGIYLIHSAIWWVMAQSARVFVRLFPDAIPEARQIDVLEIQWLATLILLTGLPIIVALAEWSYRRFEKPVYDLRWRTTAPALPQRAQTRPPLQD